MPSIESFPTKRGTVRFTEEYVLRGVLLGYITPLYRDYCQRGTWWSSTALTGYALAFPIGAWWVASAVRGSNLLHIAAVGGLMLVLWAVDFARGFRSPDRIRLDTIEQALQLMV